jgi:hypothetical protein
MTMTAEVNPVRFARWMASPPVRLLRIAAGSAMVVWGYTEGTVTGTVIGTIGIFPMLGGLYDFFILAPLFGAPMGGQEGLHPRSQA